MELVGTGSSGEELLFWSTIPHVPHPPAQARTPSVWSWIQGSNWCCIGSTVPSQAKYLAPIRWEFFMKQTQNIMGLIFLLDVLFDYLTGRVVNLFSNNCVADHQCVEFWRVNSFCCVMLAMCLLHVEKGDHSLHIWSLLGRLTSLEWGHETDFFLGRWRGRCRSRLPTLPMTEVPVFLFVLTFISLIVILLPSLRNSCGYPTLSYEISLSVWFVSHLVFFLLNEPAIGSFIQSSTHEGSHSIDKTEIHSLSSLLF